MEYSYDAQTDDLYVRVSPDPVDRTVEMTPSCLVDVNEDGAAVGIEVLNASRGWPVRDIVERFNLDEIHPLLADLGGSRFMPDVSSSATSVAETSVLS